MPPRPKSRFAAGVGAFLALAAVILGAGAAHGPLHDFLASRNTLDLWHTALTYQWYHALAFLALAPGPFFRPGPFRCWLIGLFCFSGSLYLLACDPGQRWAGPITPLGGLFLIIGWAWLILELFRPAPGSPETPEDRPAE